MKKNEANSPLTEEQQLSWHSNGYLHLKGVLPEGEVIRLLKAVDIIIQARDSGNPRIKSTLGNEYYNILHTLDYTDALDNLLDYPELFDVVTYLMGPYLQVMSSDIFVRHSNPSSSDVGKFHTDGGPSMQRILPTRNNLPLQFKVQYFLTDMLSNDSSNFLLIPGSHLKQVNYHHPVCYVPQCNKYTEQGLLPPDTIQIKAKAGDVLIHPWSLWHAIAPNKSPNTRKSVSIRYGQMWFKPYYNNITKSILDRLTPRQRRLLGDFGSEVGADVCYRPPSDQVSLMLAGKAADYGW